MGAVLQQRVKNAWQPLAFFSKRLNPVQQKHSAYDRELLAIYEAVNHFRYVLEAHHFTIFTDHKPLTYAFQQKRDKCSPRQFNRRRVCRPVHDRYKAHLRTTQLCRRRPPLRRVRHCTTIL
jgi:hypothetical protein